MEESVSWLRAMDPRETKLNILLFALPITLYFNYVNQNHSMAFFSSLIAIMPLAFLMGRATEEIALRTTESLGGLLNATFGNAAELIIAVLLILEASRVADPETQSFFIQLVQASLIGSILGNLLLVMGLAFVWGGIHHSEQKYSETQVSSNGSLLLLSMIVLVIPTVFHSSVVGEGGDSRLLDLSHIAAAILLLVYGLFLLFQFRTHVHLFATDGSHHEEPEMTQRDSIILLVVATVLVSWMAEILFTRLSMQQKTSDFPTLSSASYSFRCSETLQSTLPQSQSLVRTRWTFPSRFLWDPQPRLQFSSLP